jgi:branched-chain amino acid transport system ATP-binding protein
MRPLLSIQGLSRRFGGVQALSDVSMQVLPGEICSVIGPNGAGKTTLFNIISRLIREDDGELLLDGEPLRGVRPHQMSARGVARTFQNLAVFKHRTVVENILVGMHARLHTGMLGATFFLPSVRRAEIEAREQAEEIIEFLEIESLRDQPVGSLSYGLQKRVELGRALAVQPRLLLLDEMVSGMNQEETEDIARFILDVREQRGVTVLMIEHEMGIVMDISDRVVALNFGHKLAEGTAAEVSADPAVIDAYLGQRRAA